MRQLANDLFRVLLHDAFELMLFVRIRFERRLAAARCRVHV